MMHRTLIFLCILFAAALFAQWPVVRSQDSWHLGSGLADTTGQWGNRYFAGGGINNAAAPLMLLADPASCDYNNWVVHTIDNSNEIGTFNWCVYPRDLNGDGIPDIVANLSDNSDDGTARVVWYEGPTTGWTYTRRNIHTYTAEDRCAGAYPADIDGDGDIDVVAGDGNGLHWFENNGSGGGWTHRSIYNCPYGLYRGWYYDVGDADGDGWLDVLVTDVEREYVWPFSYTYHINCRIFWNTGSPPNYFDGTYTALAAFPAPDSGQHWRAVFFDPDPADGFLDVALEKITYYFTILGSGADDDSLIVMLQNPARTFANAFTHVIDARSTNMGHDGLWSNDFDGDGDQDLVVAVADNDLNTPGYFFLIQSDPGNNFTYHWLFDDPNSSYGDGAIMFDMDGDGMLDVVGTCDSLGYFRRTGSGYNDFALYKIDNIPDGTHFASHWVYPYNLDRGDCSGDADIDLLVVFDDGSQEGIRIYENQMFYYVTSGSLYSAILGILLPLDTCVVCSLYWEGCQLPEYTISVAGRIGESLSDCQIAGWGTVSTNPYNDAPRGWYMGEIHNAIDTAWVQYYIRISVLGPASDLSPLVDSVWVKLFPIDCESCDDIEAQWICPVPCFSYSSCEDQVMQLVMWYPSANIDTSQVWFTMDDGVNPPFVLSEPNSHLNFTCLSGPPHQCDSMFVEISGYTWIDGAAVILNL